MAGAGLIWDLFAKDQASPAFLRVAGAADKAAASTERATKSMAATTARMGKVGASLTKKVTLPLLAIGAVSIAQAAKYQKSMNTIAVATGQTSAQLAATSKGLEGIAKSTGTNLDQLAASLYTAEKGGLRNAKALAVVKAAAQGAKAENTDLATATQALTSVMASYGTTLRDPVRAENEIIKGAGLAKTTMQDFASSLSNVVPIASSLGIGFDQVAGAIATMTQHGETAQRATENLANLITNLAGQNNVAAQALGQLGVNTIDLSKNLGKRGLTGSLNIVLAALARHGKAGLIVTSAFKHSATAAASLRTELAHMPKALQTNAKAFDAGKMSYKDFNAFAKSLGGNQYQMAKGFLATEGVAKGFNNQLKNGNSTTRTLASTLQKALGGVTGMRVALMLSGQSADTFAKSTQAVKKAAGETKGDVLGWASTQDTLSVKIDKAKASLQVMAVELGTALLPAIGKLVDAGSKAVHWFDGLSGTQKQVLGWSLGVIAALGPILSIGSRLVLVGRGIGTFVGGVGTTLSRLAGSTAEQAARVGVAMRRMGSALAGAGVGYAIGTLTKHSSTGAKAVGALASAAAGAAIGFGVGGPWGAAIGGAAGLVSNLATNFLGARDATQKETDALDAQRQAALDLAGVLSNTAFNKQAAAVKGSAIAELTKSGAYNNDYSISPTILTDAALGSYGAIQRATNVILRANGDLGKSWNKVSQTSKDAIRSLNQKIFDATEKARLAEVDYEHMSQAAGTLGFTHVKLSKEVAQFGTTLDKSTAYGQRNTFVIQQQAKSLADLAVKHSTSGAAAVKAAGKYTRQEDALRAAAIAAGFNKDQIEKLTAKYQHLPKQVVTELKKIGVTPGQIEGLISKYGHIPKAVLTTINKKGVTPGDIQAIFDKYNLLDGKVVTTTVNTVYRTTHSNDANPGTHGDQTIPTTTHTRRPARGGFITGPGTGTSDSIPAMLSNGEYVINAKQTSKHRPLLNAINKGVKGFSSGGAVGHKPAPVYSYGGIDYASKRAADNAAARDAASKRQDIVSGGTSAIAALLAAAHNILSTGADLRDAAKQLRDAAKAGQVSADTLNRFAREGRRLTLLGNRRDRVAARLGTAPTAPTAYDRLGTAQQNYRDERSTVSSAITGSFDITQAGGQGSQYGEPVTLSGIRSQLAKAVANARRFTRLLKKLGREGLNRTLLSQLAAAGPSALPQAQALASATPKQLASINSGFRSLNAYGGSAGKYMADQMYGAGVNSAQALVNGLRSKESALTKAIRRLAEKMVKQLRTSLDMHSPSRRLYREMRLAWRGAEMATDDAGRNISNAASRILGNRSTPASQNQHWGRGGYVHIEKQELHVHYPESGDLNEGIKQAARMTAQQIRVASQDISQ